VRQPFLYGLSLVLLPLLSLLVPVGSVPAGDLPARSLPAGVLLSGLGPSALQAQEPVPARMVADEMARSRLCVPVLSRLEELNLELEPLARRVDRIGALYEAVVLEDAERVQPFDDGSPEDRQVRDWFARDGELAEQFVESGDEAVLEERRALRIQLVASLEDAFTRVSEEADAILARDEDLPRLAGECDGAILVRTAVLETCPQGEGSAVCREARSREPGGQNRFVEAAEDLWDVEQLRPWSNPSGIGPTPDGMVAGGQTSTVTRRGNVLLGLRLEPLLRERSAVTEEEAAEFDANLESMGFVFDDPRFVMAPALVIELDMDQPLDEETHYLLHFGDLSAPAEQVFWTARADQPRPIRDGFPVSEGILVRLMSGEEVTLTAIRIDETSETMEGIPLFTLGLTSVGQAQAVTALIAYMAGGELAEDLRSIFPPN
jgi:hypothetical protein